MRADHATGPSDRPNAPSDYGPHKTLYNRFVRCSRNGVFAEVFLELARAGQPAETIMIDSTHIKAPRTAASLAKGEHFRAISDARRAA